MSKSAAELEREAEAVRAQMSQTADTLQLKLSPGQLVDEMTSYFKNSDGRVALDNFKHQVRDNPLPLALVGAGLAWLFMGGGPSADRLAMARHRSYDPQPSSAQGGLYRETNRGSTSTTGSSSIKDRASSAYSSATSAASSAAGSISGTASSAAGSVSDTVSSTADAISDTASRSWQSMRDTGQGATDGIYNAGSKAQRMISDTLDKEPLILGAVGLAVGAAIGALMPRTQTEDAYLRPYAEKATEAVKDVVQQGVDETRNIASKVYDETLGDENKSGGGADRSTASQSKSGTGQAKTFGSQQPSSTSGSQQSSSQSSSSGTAGSGSSTASPTQKPLGIKPS